MQGSDLRVYAVISSHAGTDGRAWPSLDRIAEFLGVNKSNVCRSVRRLVDSGYIIKLMPGGGRKKSTVYRIKREPEKGVSGDTVNDPRQSNFFARKVVTGDNETVSPMTPKYNRDITNPPYPPEHRGASVEPDGSSQDLVGSPEGDEMDGANAPPLGQSGSPDGERLNPATAIAELKKLSATGARVKNPDQKALDVSQSLQFAWQKLREYFGDNATANEIIIAADDPDHPDHKQAADACKRAAKQLSIHWTPPKRKALA